MRFADAASPRPRLCPSSAGLSALAAVAWYSRSECRSGSAGSSRRARHAVGGAIRPHRRRIRNAALPRASIARWRRASCSLLPSPLALAAGIVLGLLAYLVRAFPALQRVDRSVADWAFAHRSSFSTSGLNAITSLGTAQVVIVLAVVVAAVDYVRTRNRWSASFSDRRPRRDGADHARSQRSRRTRPPGARARRGPSRAVVPEWALCDRGGVLCSRRPGARQAHVPARASAACRSRCGSRRGGCREPGPARPPLAVRRHRRPGARLGLVRTLRGSLRRAPAQAGTAAVDTAAATAQAVRTPAPRAGTAAGGPGSSV